MPAAKTRLAGVPGPFGERDKLNDAAVAANQQMRRNLEPPDLGKIRVSVSVERVGEQRGYLVAAVLARWQADAVYDDQARVFGMRSRVPIGAIASLRLHESAGGFVHREEA